VKDGGTNFCELQAALAAGRQEALTFNAFDLLFLEGFDVRDARLIERKRILKELLDEVGVSGPILYADHLVLDRPRLFAHPCKLGFEGIISKKPMPRTGRNGATRGSKSSAYNGRSFRLWDS
jgi:bifunctional non-homologous end joining protein LigD